MNFGQPGHVWKCMEPDGQHDRNLPDETRIQNHPGQELPNHSMDP